MTHPDNVSRSEPATTDSTQLFPLVLSWLFVGIPALWGVAQVVKKSLALFR
jgi:hypothetical protein